MIIWTKYKKSRRLKKLRKVRRERQEEMEELRDLSSEERAMLLALIKEELAFWEWAKMERIVGRTLGPGVPICVTSPKKRDNAIH